MKITKLRLKQIIKEELENVLKEQLPPPVPSGHDWEKTGKHMARRITQIERQVTRTLPRRAREIIIKHRRPLQNAAMQVARQAGPAAPLAIAAFWAWAPYVVLFGLSVGVGITADWLIKKWRISSTSVVDSEKHNVFTNRDELNKWIEAEKNRRKIKRWADETYVMRKTAEDNPDWEASYGTTATATVDSEGPRAWETDEDWVDPLLKKENN